MASKADTPSDVVALDPAVQSFLRYDGDINAPATFDELIAESRAAGLAEEDIVFIASPYAVLNKDKDALLDVPFYIRHVRFTEDKETKAPYCVFYAITRDNEMFAVTDGSTGIFKQLVREVNRRAAAGHKTPTSNLLIANGLRKSEYKIASGENAGRDAVTYYLA